MTSLDTRDTLDTRPQEALHAMLKIAWTRGPNLPQGFQDSDGGFLGSDLITVGGFCGGSDDHMKPGVYPRGFLKKTWAWDIAKDGSGWLALPDFPGVGRQALCAVVAGGVLHCWGGFNYTSPFTYQDGYRLSRMNDGWVWEALPPLPYPVSASSACAIGTKVYVFGGADYDYERFYTETDRTGVNVRLGAHLLVLDTERLSAGWEQLSDCPGTPRAWNAMAAVDDRIYIIGGVTGDRPVGAEGSQYCSVVDNWCYIPNTGEWERLRDLPISSGNFPKGDVVFNNRYLVLIGGFQYDNIANPDGTVREKYGTASKIDGEGGYFNDVFVYDTQSGQFGTADPLPINNNLPMAAVRGDEVFVVGGECDPRLIEGEYYGRHPDLVLRGKIEEM